MALLDEQAYIGYPQMGRRRAMPNTDVQMNQGLLRGASYYPYDLLGSPIDLINMGLKPLGLGSQKPVMGSDYLQSLAQQYGLSQQPTGSNAENVARLAMSAMNPTTGARAVGKVVEPTMQALAPKAGQMAEDYLRSIGGIADIVPQGKKSMTAMQLAQKNAALPISEGGLGLPTNNTAMDRAKAMGFDLPFFHGQKPTVEKEYIEGLGYFESEPQLNLINEIRRGVGKAEEGAFFGTIDADIASKYATKKGVVYPLVTRSQDLFEAGFTKPYPLNGAESQKDLWIKEAERFNRELDKNKERYITESILDAEKANKGGAIIRNIEDNPMDYIGAPQTDVLAIQSAPVRSRFAAFDPMQIKNPNIMAGFIPFGLLGDDEEY